MELFFCVPKMMLDRKWGGLKIYLNGILLDLKKLQQKGGRLLELVGHWSIALPFSSMYKYEGTFRMILFFCNGEQYV